VECDLLNLLALTQVIPFGADITALCPRVLNINRGQIIAYCLALPICPWYILNR
jgi:NCS1 family nucleobase:cation symporter-1